MKKIITCAFAALLVALVAPLTASAQSDNFVSPPSTERTHSLSLSIIPLGAGLYYSYEQPLWRTGTIIGRVGAEAGVAWGNNMLSGNYGWWAIAPTVDIEPRWYYGLDRRDRHGRDTSGNAGSFLAMQIKNVLPLGYISDRDLRLTGATIVTPMWGLRRVWADHWQFEFTAGYSVSLGWEAGLTHSPHLGVRFGYAF